MASSGSGVWRRTAQLGSQRRAVVAGGSGAAGGSGRWFLSCGERESSSLRNFSCGFLLFVLTQDGAKESLSEGYIDQTSLSIIFN